MDPSEARFRAMEQELLVNREKTDIIQLALQAIMSKLEINTGKPRDESEVNFTLAEEVEGSKLSTGYVKVKPASPSDFNRDQEKGGAFLNMCHIYFSV